jgi:hypothetical protein
MSSGRKKIISGKSLRAMRVPQVDAGPRGMMGITWFIRDIGKFKVYAHGGATNGQQAYLFFIPDKEFACAILTNSDDGGIITAGIFGLVLETYFKVVLKSPEPIDIASKELKEFEGRYKIGTECFDIKTKDKYLMYHHIPLGGFPTPNSPPGPAMPVMRFQFYKKDKVIGLDEPYKGALGDILRNKDGSVEYFRIGGRAHKKIK